VPRSVVAIWGRPCVEGAAGWAQAGDGRDGLDFRTVTIHCSRLSSFTIYSPSGFDGHIRQLFINKKAAVSQRNRAMPL